MLPESIAAGDTLDFTKSVPAYPPADGWTIKYRLIGRAGAGGEYLLTGSTYGTDYRIQASPATTAGWTPGEYGYEIWVEKTGARYPVDRGQITIRPDPSTIAAGTDTRSQARRAVEDLDAALATWSATTGHVRAYQIAGRQMEFKSTADILALRAFWQGRLDDELAELARAKGQKNPRRLYVRFGNA